MEPIELLDILGNENRRRILQLLSFRPFYFNEISKRLDVGPKAVIDHLDMLERAGLIECYQDQKRRKYFRIAKKTILEVAVSPHSYGVRAFRSEESFLEAPHPRVVVKEAFQDMKKLQRELNKLEEQRRDLRSLMDEIELKEIDLKMEAAKAIHICAKDQLEAEVMLGLLSGSLSAAHLADKLEVPVVVVEDLLKRLEMRGIVQNRDKLWSI